MHLELARIGWSMEQFNVMKNRSGFEVRLTDFSPKAVQQMMAKDYYAEMQKEIGQHLSAGERLTMEPIKKLINSKKDSARQKRD